MQRTENTYIFIAKVSDLKLNLIIGHGYFHIIIITSVQPREAKSTHKNRWLFKFIYFFHLFSFVNLFYLV